MIRSAKSYIISRWKTRSFEVRSLSPRDSSIPSLLGIHIMETVRILCGKVRTRLKRGGGGGGGCSEDVEIVSCHVLRRVRSSPRRSASNQSDHDSPLRSTLSTKIPGYLEYHKASKLYPCLSISKPLTSDGRETDPFWEAGSLY